MKSLRLKILLLGLSLVCFWGCNKTDDGSYTTPITLYEKVGGSWSLKSLKMVDEFAKANEIKPDEQNLESFFNYQDFKLLLNVDQTMNPTSYKVEGNVPPLFEPSGYWELSSPFQPTTANAVRIKLYSDASKSKLTEELRLTSIPGSTSDMQVQLVRSSEGTAYLSYIFNLTATN
ncbi:DUF5004 domain-containing protein [Galbibacter sp. PAP.153]|uniref:DUF5004 domain-containing protein n=1 Tax=Galbibacter sp. PAP.153 TaxID=3104623 RepID=UPI003008CF27